MPRLSTGLRHAHQLKAMFARLRSPGGIKEYGGLRATITRLKALKHRPGKMIHERAVMPEPDVLPYLKNKSLQLWYTEPKTGTTGLVNKNEYSPAMIRKRITSIRKKFRPVRRTS